MLVPWSHDLIVCAVSSCNVEFIDTEWYQAEPLVVFIEKEGWTRGLWADQVVLLDQDLVSGLAQPDRLTEIQRKDIQILDDLEVAIRHRGFDEPLLVLIDKNGKVVLRDGHHRLVVSRRLGIKKLPVRFKKSENIRYNAGMMARDVLPRILFDE